MPSAFASPTWRNVSEALQQHRTDCATFAVEVESVLASLAMLRESLHQQGCQLASERERARAAERAAEAVIEKNADAEVALADSAVLRQTLETRQAQLQTAQAEIDRLKAQLDHSSAATSDSSQEDRALQVELAALREERNSLREQLSDSRREREAALSRSEAAEVEVRKLTASAIDSLAQQQAASQARADLAAAQQELIEVQAALAAAREETATSRQELAARQAEWLEKLRDTPATDGASSSDWSEAAQEQFTAFQLRVEQTLEECAKWASAAIQATETREELSALRVELQSRPLELDSSQIHTSGEWERERGALETELELVRARAAELYESLSRQERGLSELRTELGGDLKQLRRLVESQAELMLARQGAEPIYRESPVGPLGGASKAFVQASAQATAQADSHGQDPADPVLSSVMAQFARLQQDVAERRKKKKP